jgi:Transcriptional regulator PadR-like family
VSGSSNHINGAARRAPSGEPTFDGARKCAPRRPADEREDDLPLLTRLRKDQLVTTTWRESKSGPPRRYYQLTESGHAALASFVKEWARFRGSVDAILNGRKGDAHHGD